MEKLIINDDTIKEYKREFKCPLLIKYSGESVNLAGEEMEDCVYEYLAENFNGNLDTMYTTHIFFICDENGETSKDNFLMVIADENNEKILTMVKTASNDEDFVIYERKDN